MARPWMLPAALLCPLVLAVPATAQYVGKVAATPATPPLRAVAVYEYTGALTRPNASRLVPVVVWDGTNFQPGGLYKAQPEPLAVSPGTQYVLTPDGVPGGRYNVLSSAELNGGWVGLGRYALAPAPPPPRALHASKTLPVLHGGSLDHAKDVPGASESPDGGPVLHRHAGSEEGSSGTAGSGSGSGSGSQTGSSTGPVLHKRDGAGADTSGSTSEAGPTLHRRGSDGGAGSEAGSGAGSGAGSETASGTSGGAATAPPEDPDRPRLHEGTEKTASPEPDRPLLHRAPGSTATTAEGAPPPDPGRPRLRYGSGEAGDTRVLPTLLKAAPKTLQGAETPVGQVVAISDVTDDEPHSFAYTWPSDAAKADAEARMHALALRELANVAAASFGPAAKNGAELKRAADAAEASFGSGAATPGFGPGAPKRVHGARSQAAAADPLLDPEFHAFELSYGGGGTLVYSAHTAPEGADRQFVTVIAQLNFAGAPQKVFAQTTRGDMLTQTPALHLIDAVDAKGDHRAELLFDERTSDAAVEPRDRQFALFSVYGGQASEVYSSGPGVVQ